jgi:hypothetical protein
MSKKVIIYVVLVFFALSMNVVFSGMEYPQELKKEIAPYPSSQNRPDHERFWSCNGGDGSWRRPGFDI